MKNKEQIRILNFFDFDGTVVKGITPEMGKEIWKEKTGRDYPHNGWWSKEESLDTNVFDFERNDKIYSIFNIARNKQDVYNVILTNRIKFLKPKVLLILKNLQMTFDNYSFKTDEKNKAMRIQEIITEFPNVKTINVYDDMEDQIQILKTLRSKLSDIEVNIYRVNDNVLISEDIIQTVINNTYRYVKLDEKV